MFKNVAGNTDIIFYFMMAASMLGIFAKIVNQLSLSRMVRAAGNMSKSSHKLMKLVRDQYKSSCMLLGTVDNTNVFIEKHLYEYRGFLFRIHTWRQLEIQTIWLSGILAVLGTYSHYMAHGFCEGMYQYIVVGAAQMILLSVIMQLSDESYQMKMSKTYMLDYLDNVCSYRYQRRYTEKREWIDVLVA